MLCLTRKRQEAVDITVDDTAIEVLVLEIVGDRVRLAIDAPGHVTIHRREVTIAIQRAKHEQEERERHRGRGREADR